MKTWDILWYHEGTTRKAISLHWETFRSWTPCLVLSATSWASVGWCSPKNAFCCKEGLGRRKRMRILPIFKCAVQVVPWSPVVALPISQTTLWNSVSLKCSPFKKFQNSRHLISLLHQDVPIFLISFLTSHTEAPRSLGQMVMLSRRENRGNSFLGSHLIMSFSSEMSKPENTFSYNSQWKHHLLFHLNYFPPWLL